MSGNIGWIGVDLDGTLAEYDGWKGAEHIGKPVPAMLGRIKLWLSEGKDVKIFTARVCRANPEREFSRMAIQKWLITNLGRILEIVSEKDYGMVELWDDRCVQVIPNTGIALQELREKSVVF